MVTLGQRQVTPEWVDDPARRHIDGWGGREGVVCLPMKDIRRQKREGGAVSISKLYNNKGSSLGPEWSM